MKADIYMEGVERNKRRKNGKMGWKGRGRFT